MEERKMLDVTSLSNLLSGFIDAFKEMFEISDVSESTQSIFQVFWEVLRMFIAMIINSDI